MTTSAEQWLKDNVEAINSKDIDQLLSNYSDDCIMEVIPSGTPVTGKEEIRNFYEVFFMAYPDFNLEIKSNFASGNQVCGESIMSGTHKGKMPDMPIEPTGKHFSVRSASVTEVKDGKAYKARIYFDMASLLQQLGVMPGPPQ